MKQRIGFLIYLILIVIFAVGVLAPNEAQQTFTDSSRIKKKTTGQTNSDPVSLSANVKAKKADKTLSANSQRVIVTNNGDNLLVLINKTIRLPETYEPKDLQEISSKITNSKQGILLRKSALNGLVEMKRAAKKNGINLVVLSAYRSYWSQQATFQQWVKSSGVETSESFSARPGYSQHQLGTALDFVITSPESANWLEKNSYVYGFILSYPKGKEKITGYKYEPWHYRFIGVRNAIHMVESGMILEEYLQEFGVW